VGFTCPKCGTDNTAGSKYCRECAAPLPTTSPSDVTLPLAGGEAGEGSGAAPATAAEDFAPGALFAGRFRIIEALGGGGMGRVYKALDTKVGEKVALKRILPEFASDRDMLARFSDEMRLARRIAHPNVCRVFDMGEADGAPYISMEYVAGEELKNILRMTQGLSPGQTASIGKQVAAGLAEAHRLGVIHRDLKPQNIMIDREGTARIMDFGIARLSRADRSRTGRGVMIGTPDYMSPEQAEGAEIDARSDLYSLGAMLFEMATGRLPFEAPTAVGMAVKHKTEAPPDPRSINPRIPDDLNRLILELLQKDPVKRPQTAAEVRDALERIEKEVPTTTPVVSRRATSTARQVTVSFPLKKAAVPAAAIALLAAGVFIATRILWHRGSSAAPKIPNSIAVIGFENQTGDPKYDHLRKAIPELITTNLENMGRFQVTTWERMQDLLRQAGRADVEVIDPEAGFEICRKEGVAAIVTGSFTKAGDTFATNVKLLDAEPKKLLKSASSRGEGENSILRTQIDELSGEIVKGLAPAGPAPAEKPAVPVMEATTKSMEAYAAFLRGRDDLYRYKTSSAIAQLERAVALDPGFAIAHCYLGRAYSSTGDMRRSGENYRLSRSNAARASEKERLLIEALYTGYVAHDRPGQIRMLNDLVRAYPSEKTAWTELGRTLNSSRRLDEAAAALQKALDLDPTFGEAINLLAYNNVDNGRYDEAAALFQRYASLFPDDANPIDSLAELDYVRGRLPDAEAGYRRASAIDPRFGGGLRVAWMQTLQERYDDALGTLGAWKAQNASDVETAGIRLFSAIILHLQGRGREAQGALREGRALADAAKMTAAVDYIEGWFDLEAGRWVRSRAAFRRLVPSSAESPAALTMVDPAVQEGLAFAAEGNLAAAKAILAKAEDSRRSQGGTPFGVMSDMIDLLRSRILAAEGNLEGARGLLVRERPAPQIFQGFLTLVPSCFPMDRDDLARIYVRQGKREDAIAQYKILTVIGPDHRNRDLIYPLYHYRLAKLYEEVGRAAEAKAEYGRFLKVLEKADKESPEMADARKRLAAL